VALAAVEASRPGGPPLRPDRLDGGSWAREGRARSTTSGGRRQQVYAYAFGPTARAAPGTPVKLI